jgi:hypothetical protein
MPDEHYPTFPQRDPERILQAAIKTDLEFIMARIAALPTRRELIHFGIWVALGLCVLALIGLRMWMNWVWACSPL